MPEKKYIRANILFSEAACPHCNKLPTDEYLDWFQHLRDKCGFPLPFNSMYRCPEYNKSIGGSDTSVHLLGAEPGIYGAADIGIDRFQSKKRWILMYWAFHLGMNNFEVADGHLHIGIAPTGHPQSESLYWGKSK